MTPPGGLCANPVALVRADAAFQKGKLLEGRLSPRSDGATPIALYATVYRGML
jgi:hypothetical protein